MREERGEPGQLVQELQGQGGPSGVEVSAYLLLLFRREERGEPGQLVQELQGQGVLLA
jgi:hypothetical protein